MAENICFQCGKVIKDEEDVFCCAKCGEIFCEDCFPDDDITCTDYYMSDWDEVE